ncbi:MAG: YbjN domain-containing protein [Solimonas sp.]
MSSHHKNSDNGKDAGKSADVRTTVSPAEVVAVLHDAGFRASLVEDAKRPRVRSAVQGLAFSVDFVSQPNADQQYVDFAFHCPIRIDGELPDTVINRWNRAKRFVRLVRNEKFLYVTMDVLLAGGVTLQHLRAHCELWDHLIRELVLHLQQPAGLDMSDAVAAAAPAAPAAPAGA